jgi:hypothetical protein
MALFASLQRSEQLHSLNVLRAILADDNETPRALAVAALLHDAGKARYPLRVWQKTLAVLVRAVHRGLAARLSAGDPRHPLTRPFVVSAQHPAWSAELLRAAAANAPTEADETAIWLVEHHADDADSWADHPLYPLLVRLQAADDLN